MDDNMEKSVEFNTRMVMMLQSVLYGLREFLETTTITTIPYQFRDDYRVSNMVMSIESINIELQNTIDGNLLDVTNPLEIRKKKLDKYLMSDLSKRMDDLEKENEELRKLLKRDLI